jgi:AcrR family transcriptional regulator
MKKTTDDRSAEQRELILDAAKQHCAQHGWSRMTVRAIAKYANVNSALLGYYFENKETLERELIRFTSQRLELCRRETLARLHQRHGEVVPAQALIRAFAEPFLVRKHPLRDEVLVYLSTTVHLLGSPTDPKVGFARSINRDINKTFLNEIGRSLAHVDAETLHVRFEMMLGAMVFTSALANGSRGVAYFSRAMLAGEKLLAQFAQDWAAVFSLPPPGKASNRRKSSESP